MPDRTATDCTRLYSLNGQRIDEEEIPDSQAKDALKDGRATSMSQGSGDTEAPTYGEMLQDTDDESEYRASPDLQEPLAAD